VETTALAVLPFQNLSSNAENEYLSDGITEEIISALSRVNGLKVISKTSSFFFKGKALPLSEIAKELNVEHLLEGSVQRQGNRVRISAQLIDIADDSTFWSGKWDRELDDLFALQDEISLLIADQMREQFGHMEIDEHLVTSTQPSPDAYQLTLQARHHFNLWNPASVQQSIAMFEEAHKLDPEYVEPMIGLADAYSFLATTQAMPPAEAWPLFEKYLDAALQREPHHAFAHYLLANKSFFTACDYRASFAHAQRAVELDPTLPEALQFMSYMYALRDDFDKSQTKIEEALAVDPLNQETLFFKAFYLYRSKHFEGALQQLDALLKVNPQSIPSLITQAYILFEVERLDEMQLLIDRFPEGMIIPSEITGLRCLHAIRSGDTLAVQQHLSALEEFAETPSNHQAHSYLYLAYINLHRFDDAVGLLEKWIPEQSSILLLTFADPMASAFRNDSRFKVWHEQLYGLPDLPPPTTGKKAQLLSDEEATNFQEVLDRYMRDEEVFLSPDLSLRQLAGDVGIHPNQLSWLLNSRYGKNFNAFVNDYRLDHFKQLASDPANAHISLIGLAYESGFNSKSVFNTYFKKREGLTPSAYLKSLGAN
jgi:TolB-like protein/AraC-like DNA-binding protein